MPVHTRTCSGLTKRVETAGRQETGDDNQDKAGGGHEIKQNTQETTRYKIKTRKT